MLHPRQVITINPTNVGVEEMAIRPYKKPTVKSGRKGKLMPMSAKDKKVKMAGYKEKMMMKSGMKKK